MNGLCCLQILRCARIFSFILPGKLGVKVQEASFVGLYFDYLLVIKVIKVKDSFKFPYFYFYLLVSMKIDRKKLANKCGYDQTECLLLAKRLASLPNEDFLKELQRIKVWNYGKCELGLWADVLDRLDAILEDVTTKVGTWSLKVDSPGNENLVQDVVTVLEFTSHLIEHSIYRCLYGSWSHILSLFSTGNMDILLAVLGLTYNFR